MTTPTADFDLAHTYRGIPWERSVAGAGTLLDVLAERAGSDEPWLTAFDPGGGSVTLSFRDLDTQSARLASTLRQRLAIESGDVVGLIPRNDVPSVLALFALVRSGCPVLLLSPHDPAARLREQASRRAVAVLRAPQVPADTLPEAIEIPASDLYADSMPPAGTEPAVAVRPLDTALMFGTSGSTAAAKIVAQSHAAALANAQALRRHHRLGPGDRLLGCLPIHHVNGVHFTLLATLYAGAHAVLANAFDALGYPRLLAATRPRVASVVPSILETLVCTWRETALPDGFEYFVSAAAPLSREIAQAVHRVLGARVMQGYGLTETTNFSTTMPPDVSDAAYRRFMLDADIPSVGIAVDGNEVAVLRPDGSRARHAEVGEVCMRGHNVMTGYAGNEEATGEAFRRGWFHSGDRGFAILDEESGRDFFVLVGRTKNIAKVRGESVSLEEVDRALRVLPGVLDAGCVAVPHRLFGEEVLAAVVPERPGADGDRAPAEGHADWRRQLHTVLPAHAVPSRIVVLPRVPRTPTGKILRRDLARELAPNVGADDKGSGA
jgi:acyl-CoA synthetase (AMP-forming)/AMP-acid ligase II